mmetsp:Transcript_82676/g.161177  ORF Transcript_82676/g.161177 Transcript_82676/m.161177 type:complete len:204 (+) Transcript_82676:471-1082(+)
MLLGSYRQGSLNSWWFGCWRRTNLQGKLCMPAAQECPCRNQDRNCSIQKNVLRSRSREDTPRKTTSRCEQRRSLRRMPDRKKLLGQRHRFRSRRGCSLQLGCSTLAPPNIQGSPYSLHLKSIRGRNHCTLERLWKRPWRNQDHIQGNYDRAPWEHTGQSDMLYTQTMFCSHRCRPDRYHKRYELHRRICRQRTRYIFRILSCL